jgi:hypothetical protein
MISTKILFMNILTFLSVIIDGDVEGNQNDFNDFKSQDIAATVGV